MNKSVQMAIKCSKICLTAFAKHFVPRVTLACIAVLVITPEKAIKLTANDYFRHKLELLKIQMQDAGRVAAQAKLAGKTVEKISATKLASQLLKEKGVLGLYKDIGGTGLRDVTFSVVYSPLFAALNAMRPRRNDGSGEAVFWCSFLTGLAAGSFAALFVNPLDVVKTRLQAIKKS